MKILLILGNGRTSFGILLDKHVRRFATIHCTRLARFRDFVVTASPDASVGTHSGLETRERTFDENPERCAIRRDSLFSPVHTPTRARVQIGGEGAAPLFSLPAWDGHVPRHTKQLRQGMRRRERRTKTEEEKEGQEVEEGEKESRDAGLGWILDT